MDYVISKAEISSCGKYRYFLQRTWDDNLRAMTFIMLNPSTADESEDDRTIKNVLS